MRWSELSPDGVLTIPGERTKSGRALTLSLPDAALALLPPGREGREYVFGPRGGPMRGWSDGKLRLDARIAMTSGRAIDWRLHDLRRTMRSGLGRLSVPPHIAELAIGHTKPGLQSIYDHHDYRAEIGNALGHWAEHVTALVEERPAKVRTLRA